MGEGYPRLREGYPRDGGGFQEPSCELIKRKSEDMTQKKRSHRWLR